MLGGSYAYGLNTAKSDIDHRGIYLDIDISSIIGLNKNEQYTKQDKEIDVNYTEFRHTLKLLRQANTQSIELLYNDDWLEISDFWKMVQKNRKELVDSTKLFNCLRGYMQGELRLANGERTGKLGGKRKEAIDKYGFSPKNFVQLFRLAWAGTIYFEKGYFPVDVKKECEPWSEILLDLKTNPENYDKERLNTCAKDWEDALVKSFENRKFTTIFNEELANDLCVLAYGLKVANYFESLDKRLC